MRIEPTAITLGTSGLGRHSEPGSAEGRAAVDVAIDLLTSRHGFVDTSNNYSAGRSEAVIGIALRELGMDGSRVISKVDQDPETGVFDRDRVLRSFEETTARLGVDRLPLLHLHDPYSVSFEDTISIGGAVQGLIELRSAGVVDAIGVAAAPVPLMAKYVETGVFDAVLIHNRFTLVDHSAESVFADAKARWYANADEIADFLAAANPGSWPRPMMRADMRTHLDQTLAEADHELNGDHAARVAVYEALHDHILEMADMLTSGIIDQFPHQVR